MAKNENSAEWRDYAFELRDASPDGDGRTFEGYAAVWNSPTRISGWEGDFTETVARGAFKKTLAEGNPVLMFNHGKHPSIGDLPIGSIVKAREDDRGLFIRARLFDNQMVDPVRQAIAGGAIRGMSFRFEPIRDTWSKDRKTRTLNEVRMPECGPVTFPAYAATSASVRSLGQAMDKLARRQMATTADTPTLVDALADCLLGRPSIVFQLSELYPDADDLSEPGMNSATPDGETREALDTPPVGAPVAPPSNEQKPADATSATRTKFDRQKMVAKMKGITP